MMVLSGCLSAQIPDEDVPIAAHERGEIKDADLTGVSAELAPFYGQELAWEDCEGAGAGAFDCTTVTAPLDWENPDEGELELAVVRRAANEAEPVGSLLTNPGGPGGSGYSLVADSSDYAFGTALLDAFDIVGFDPRGVGNSTAVTCYDDADTDAYLWDIPPGERGSEEWTADLEERAEAFADACAANSDGILPYITTVQSARDMDLLRAVLGDTSLNYLGFSYGTFLGATYASLFPEKVGRLVLDGAMDPSTPGSEVGLTQAKGFEQSLRLYLEDCLDQEDCPFRGTVDEAMTDVGDLFASVDEEPLDAADGRRLGADALMTAIISALYSEEYWPYLTMALTDVLAGDPGVAFVLADSYYQRDPMTGEYITNMNEAFTAYNCVDYPEEDLSDDESAFEEELASVAPTIAPYWSSSVDLCAYWAAEPTGVRAAIDAAGAAPIVVIGTSNDPATPYEWAESLASQLGSGVLISYEGDRHTAYNAGSDCVDSAVEDYLISGVVPEDGLSCAA